MERSEKIQRSEGCGNYFTFDIKSQDTGLSEPKMYKVRRCGQVIDKSNINSSDSSSLLDQINENHKTEYPDNYVIFCSQNCKNGNGLTSNNDVSCEGCRESLSNQEAHMGYGGCLSSLEQ